MIGAAESLVADAVHQSPRWSMDGILERLFAKWFDSFVYNQIWEDPRPDLDALEVRSDSHILTISSGGCNVLNYLTHRPARITAVDLNRHHIALLRLKLAAVQHLPTFEDFFRFFACADDEENCRHYETRLAPRLDESTREFWEGGGFLRRALVGPRIRYFRDGLYNHAKLGYFIRFLHLVARVHGKDLARVLEARNQEEQARIFDEEIAPLFEHWFVRLVGRVPLSLYGLGIPPQQFRAMELESDGIVSTLRERVRRLACDFPIEDNYFGWQAFGRRYDRTRRLALPDYLKREHYEQLKADAGRVTVELSTVTGWLRSQGPGAIDGVVLLDSQDWMKPEGINELWHEIARVGRIGTRIIFRTAAASSPIERALTPELQRRFTYHAERSRDLYARDRSAIYDGFHVYTMIGDVQ